MKSLIIVALIGITSMAHSFSPVNTVFMTCSSGQETFLLNIDYDANGGILNLGTLRGFQVYLAELEITQTSHPTRCGTSHWIIGETADGDTFHVLQEDSSDCGFEPKVSFMANVLGMKCIVAE